jgi:biuret amidohydrolase
LGGLIAESLPDGTIRPESTAEEEGMQDFDLNRAAFLSLDFQNYGIHPDGYWAKHGEPDWPSIARPALENTARVLAAARQSGLLVVHVGVCWRDGSPEMNMSAPLFARAPDRSVEGTWAAEFCESVKPLAGEIVVYKRGMSALAGTELDRLFRLRDVHTLVLSGVATQFAVEGPLGRRLTVGTGFWCSRTAARAATERCTISRSRRSCETSAR